MMREISYWLNSLSDWQQVGVFLLALLFGILIYAMIEGLIRDAVKKGIKDAIYELMEEGKRKRGG